MNLDLSNIEQQQLHRAMCDIATALSDLSPVMRRLVLPALSARNYDIVVSYIGTIRNAWDQIDDLLYNESVREPDPIMTPAEAAALIEPIECPICDPESPDACNPHGIVITDEVATKRLTWWQHNGQAERLTEQLQRGVITRVEYEAAMAALNARIEGGAPATSEPGVPG